MAKPANEPQLCPGSATVSVSECSGRCLWWCVCKFVELLTQAAISTGAQTWWPQEVDSWTAGWTLEQQPKGQASPDHQVWAQKALQMLEISGMCSQTLPTAI